MSTQNYFSRLEQALSLRDKAKGALAQHLGIALSTVSRWREAIPKAETVQATADWLSVDAKWLMTGKGEVPRGLENAESYGKPNESGIGESPCVVREDSPIYGARTTLSHEEEMKIVFAKVGEVIDLLEKMTMKGPKK